MISKKASISSKPKITSSSWPLPSLRLVIVCVSLAVALTMCTLIIFVDVNAPSLADIFLSTVYFPLGQGLQLKTRKWSSNQTECVHFFRMKDDNFSRFGGTQCGQAIWQSTASLEEGDRYAKKISTHYRLFENESQAKEYFNGYWHDRLRDPLPSSFYSEETDSAPKAGNRFRAFKWDPLTNTIPENFKASTWTHRASSTSRHLIYIFRYGRQ